MPRTIIKRVLPYHPRLGRNVNHDSESRRYQVAAPVDTPIVTVTHDRHVPIFDQGQLGSCTGNAGDGCMATDPFWDTMLKPHYPYDEGGAVMLYSRATSLDSYNGTYPPDDTGSDGLSIAKALKEAGEISGYLWAFTPEQARAALMSTPLITGISWYSDMFNPDAAGRVRPTGSLAGGHEIVVMGYELVGQLVPSSDDRVWFANSWGPGWGRAGTFWMSFGDWSSLLADGGDVTQFVPITAPTPVPTPTPGDVPAADVAALWSDLKHWADEKHTGDNRRAAAELRKFMHDHGVA